MPIREKTKRKIIPPERFESGTATEDNKKRLKELAKKPKFKKRKTYNKQKTISSLVEWLLEAQVGTTGNYHGKDLKVIEVNKKFVKCVVESVEGRSHALLNTTKVFAMPVSPLPSEAIVGSWYWVLWSRNYYRGQVARIFSNNEWMIKFEGVVKQYRYKHNGVFSTRVKPIHVSPEINSESNEENEEEGEQERSSEAEGASDLSIVEENEESITRNSTSAVSMTTGKQTQATDLDADSETTVLNGMTIVSSSSSSTIGKRASSPVTTGSIGTPNTIHKRTNRSNNEIHHHTYLNKSAALSLLSKEIMEFKCLFDNNAISEAIYKKWVANAKNTYDAV